MTSMTPLALKRPMLSLLEPPSDSPPERPTLHALSRCSNSLAELSENISKRVSSKTSASSARAASRSSWPRFAFPTPGEVRAAIAGALLGALVCAAASCAHVANVATACQGTITADLRNNVVAALDRDDYASALEVAGSAALPCVLVATVKEVREASAAASGTGAGEPKAMMRLDLVVRVRRADAWLAAHPNGSP
jgi:hypothetical protein